LKDTARGKTFCSIFVITGRHFMKLNYIFFLTVLSLLIFCSGCAAFSTPQERSGINPKPFNSQASWETQPFGGRITY
jgi:hypothetical protein